jgi:hypothetical protein
MSCEYVKQLISLLLDGRLPAGERSQVLAHLEACRACTEDFASMQYVRNSMRSMPSPAVPDDLTTRLRVSASHHRAAVAARRQRGARLVARLRLAFDNMMRPFAVPFAGGLASAMLCFGVLFPNLWSFQHNFALDAPIAFRTAPRIVTGFTDPDGSLVGVVGARLQSGDGLITGNEVSLTLLIDERGEVADWTVYGGELTDEMKSVILLSKFIPATVSGQPTMGMKQIVFPRRGRLRS